ncbi:MAG: phage tail sheath C-terminal domain-containing protein [Myxococcota bacterium]|nr:phage tail sheath C-terminal domain-containing protein [Myxococcota bacterium]
MDYQTPGVYIREVDSGPKPIASVATSIPGFIGLFDFTPPTDALEIKGSSGNQAITATIRPAIVDKQGNFKDNDTDSVQEFTENLGLGLGQVKDLGKYLELHGAPKSGKNAPTFKKGKEIGTVDISYQSKTITAQTSVISVDGKVVSDDDKAVEELLNSINDTFTLTAASAKSAEDVLSAYGVSFDSIEETSFMTEYSIPPVAIHNKTEYLRWLQGFFAQYLFDTEGVFELLGEEFDDEDDAVDAIFEALLRNDKLKDMFTTFMSQPSVFNFVQALNGFYDNGGGKCYVYLMGTQNLNMSLRENAADKLGLHAFDDVDEIAIMAAPGLSTRQQKEMLELCELRKDRFAVLDGPIVSTGDMEIPASAKGYGAIYVPWVKTAKPSWFKGEQKVDVNSRLRRKLIKTDKEEVFVPPSGHICGIISRVDGERGVHKAPANELLMSVTGLSQNINRIEQGQYNDRGINVIRSFKDRGIRVWGARTLAAKSDASWKYINVRRLFIMVEQSIMLGSQWAVFEPNDQTLWKKLTRDVRQYLMRVWRSGALFGQTPEEAFYVKCDAETNPQYLIDAGQVNVQVGISPVKPAEFVVFSIGQWDGGALIED